LRLGLVGSGADRSVSTLWTETRALPDTLRAAATHCLSAGHIVESRPFEVPAEELGREEVGRIGPALRIWWEKIDDRPQPQPGLGDPQQDSGRRRFFSAFPGTAR
jgi:hypothetical protein